MHIYTFLKYGWVFLLKANVVEGVNLGTPWERGFYPRSTWYENLKTHPSSPLLFPNHPKKIQRRNYFLHRTKQGGNNTLIQSNLDATNVNSYCSWRNSTIFSFLFYEQKQCIDPLNQKTPSRTFTPFAHLHFYYLQNPTTSYSITLQIHRPYDKKTKHKKYIPFMYGIIYNPITPPTAKTPNANTTPPTLTSTADELGLFPLCAVPEGCEPDGLVFPFPGGWLVGAGGSTTMTVVVAGGREKVGNVVC